MMRRRRRIASKLDRLGLGMFGFCFSHIRERFRDDTRAFYVFPQRGAIGFFRTSLFFQFFKGFFFQFWRLGRKWKNGN